MIKDAETNKLDFQQSMKEMLRQEEDAGELKISKVAVMVCLTGWLFGLTVLIGFNVRLGQILCAIAMVYAVYYALIIKIIQRGKYHPWIKYVSSTLEVSAPTLIALVDTLHQSPAYALTSSPTYLYFIAVSATTLRFRIKLSVYAGILAGLELMCLYVFLAPGIPAELVEQLPSLNVVIYSQRAIYLVLAGIMAAAISGTARRLSASFAEEMQQREYLRRMFGKYVSPVVAEHLLSQTSVLEGEMREVTILCTDIRGFTSFSSHKQPAEIVRFLNALFDRQQEIVSKYHGHVNKFLGDGMLAVFGAPFPDENHALHAAQAALEIMALQHEVWPESPEKLRLGAALNTGPVVIGNVGASEKLEYTVIGDTVNTAFRIEGLNGRLGTSVLISESTRLSLADQAVLQTFPPQMVRGKEEPVAIFEMTNLLSPE
ncbi:MAG: adenylate/guanylate cyclase domain-containing protein [SAR324 cluster bacterium]|nr:adenylate/guanylate cyclase domain-containing protein [SAR324 cluster bacterium]